MLRMVMAINGEHLAGLDDRADLEIGDDDLALQHLERALELNPENRMARRLLRELR